LLSYGFCIENNPCDSFAIKLPPTPPPLLQLVKQAHQNQGTHDLSAHETIPSLSPSNPLNLPLQPPLQTTTTSTTSATTTPLTVHNRPQAHNLTHNTFFIRHLSRHSWHEPGYPQPLPLPVLNSSATTITLDAALAGFPTLLLTTLAATLVTRHEATLVSSNPKHFSPESLYTQLGRRNWIALTNLLAQRLRVELARLPGPT